MRKPTERTGRGQGKWIFLLAVVLSVFPLAVNDAYLHHLMILSFIFAILVGTWNVLFGFMGVFSFGHQAFFGIGAYVSALLAEIGRASCRERV